MSSFKSFEDIEAWQLSRDFCRLIYSFFAKEGFSKDYKLKDQLNGASGSIMDNIAEGFGRGGNKEFQQFLRFSKGSCSESKSQLYRAFDRSYITQEEFTHAKQLLELISSKVQSLINYLNKSDFKGPNYKS